jgi:hypothetical protein
MAAPRFLEVSPVAGWSHYPVDYGAVPTGGHCGVLACAILAGTTFEIAWDVLSTGRRGRWTGGTRIAEREAFLKALNVPHKARTHISRDRLKWLRSTGSPCLNDYRPRCNVATFAARHAKPGVTYMITIARHVVTLRDGIVMDQQQAAPAAKHWTARKLIRHSIERL